ncbi:STAS domain-containing protein [Jatrophihabitans sp. DSM 45814]
MFRLRECPGVEAFIYVPSQEQVRAERVVGGAVVDLSLSKNTIDDQVVIEVRGEVDLHSATHLRDRLISAIDDGSKIVIVDLTNLGFIDSTGLGALVAARNRAEEKGATLRLACAAERLLKLFRITGLHEVFSIYSSVSEAAGADATGSLPSSTA